MNDTTRPTVPRWLHGWAILTAVTALPLIALGAEVTTKQVGMADRQAVREPWYLLTLPKDQLWAQGVGLVIEHSHRTAGWLVGLFSIVLAVGMWLGARGTGVRAAGLVALSMVILQGLLGIFRVYLHARVGPEMAMVHGLFAQVAYATLVGVAVVTSRAWRRELPAGEARKLRWLAALALVAVGGQIVFGALVRHQHGPHAQRAHVLLAFAVVAVITWLVRAAREGSEDGPVRQAATLLAGLVTVQVMLGVEAWLRRFGAGVPVDMVQPNAATDFVRSAHFFVGALLFATTVSVNLLLYGPADVAATAARPGLDAAYSEGGRITAGIGSTL
jgi:cytochrome c oxidase assembly protein subunit 15